MSNEVVYEGVTPAERVKQGLPPFGALEFQIEDEDGNVYRLPQGVPVEVSSSSLREELLSNTSGRCEGHEFSPGKAQAKAPEPEPEPEAGDGAAGSEPGATGGGPPSGGRSR